MASNVTDTLESKLLRTATAYQQNHYEIFSDWNRYESHELDYLRDYIGYAIYGPPEFRENTPINRENEGAESDDKAQSEDESFHFVYNEKQRESINLVYEKVMEYGYCEKSEGFLLCGIIYNVIFNKEQVLQAERKRIAESKDGAASKGKKKSAIPTENKDEGATAEQEIQIFPVPVFKVRRYRDANTEQTYYIDNSARVYKGFKDYLKNNTLPKCTMVIPKDGRYQIDPAFCTSAILTRENLDDIVTTVWLEIHESPANKIAAKVLMGGDIATTAVTVASMGVGIASLMTPIGAGIALASAVGAGVSGLWTVGRSAQQLADRGLHGESINVTDKSALGAWIGIAGGTMGLAATGSTVLLSRAIRTGTTVGRAATVAYDAVLIGNLIVNGVGVGFKSYDMYAIYMDKGEISPQDIFFLTTHLFFFCNSVMNIRLAQNIIETNQGQLLKDYEASLRSNRHRKEFQRMARNTRAAGINDVSSNEEIIRGINKIANKDEFFQAMVRNRKALSASGAKASFTDGKVTVNSVMIIDPIEFANLPKDVRVDIVKGTSSVVPSNNNAGTTNRINETSYKNFTANNTAVLKEFCLKHSSSMAQAAPLKIGDFSNVLSDLCTVKNSIVIFVKLLDTGYKIFQAMPREEVMRLGDILGVIVQFLWDFVKSNVRRIRPGIMIDDPSVRCLLDNLMQELLLRVEKRVDIWVSSFKEWLENRFRQSIDEPLLYKC